MITAKGAPHLDAAQRIDQRAVGGERARRQTVGAEVQLGQISERAARCSRMPSETKKKRTQKVAVVRNTIFHMLV